MKSKGDILANALKPHYAQYTKPQLFTTGRPSMLRLDEIQNTS